MESSLSFPYQTPFIISFLYAGFNFPLVLSSSPSSQFSHYFYLPCDVWTLSGGFDLTQPAKIRGSPGFVLPGENSSQKVSHLGKLRMKERES